MPEFLLTLNNTEYTVNKETLLLFDNMENNCKLLITVEEYLQLGDNVTQKLRLNTLHK